MILRFGVENYRSFEDYAEVSFVSTARQDEPAWRMPAPDVRYGVLPVVGAWGANASGKSNLVGALLELREHVASSFTQLRPGQPLPWTPWQMRKEQRLERIASEPAPSATTRMDLDFLLGGIRHHFGFRFRAEGFAEEWLFAWPGGRRMVLYHRNHEDPDPWYLGPSLKGARRQLVGATRPNSLFLSTAAQHNHAQLGPVNTAIVDGIIADTPVPMAACPLFSPESPILDLRFRDLLLRLLSAADLGIVDVKAREYKAPAGGQLPGLHRAITREFLRSIPVEAEPAPLMELVLVHEGPGGSRWDLDPAYESRGTWLFVARLNELFALLRKGGLLVLDELDTSMHPDLCSALVDLFTSKASNPNGAQILFTTHDRSLLTCLRTDEVILVDKGRDGVSRVRTASDYKDVRSREDLRRAHEQGRIRGVPVMGDLSRIMADGLHRAT